MKQKQLAAKLILGLLGIGFFLLFVIVIVALDIDLSAMVSDSVTKTIDEEIAKALSKARNF